MTLALHGSGRVLEFYDFSALLTNFHCSEQSPGASAEVTEVTLNLLRAKFCCISLFNAAFIFRLQKQLL